MKGSLSGRKESGMRDEEAPGASNGRKLLQHGPKRKEVPEPSESYTYGRGSHLAGSASSEGQTCCLRCGYKRQRGSWEQVPKPLIS